jgi:hypothetical protein
VSNDEEFHTGGYGDAHEARTHFVLVFVFVFVLVLVFILVVRPVSWS